MHRPPLSFHLYTFGNHQKYLDLVLSCIYDKGHANLLHKLLQTLSVASHCQYKNSSKQVFWH